MANLKRDGRRDGGGHARVVLGKGPNAVLRQDRGGKREIQASGEDPQCSRIGYASFMAAFSLSELRQLASGTGSTSNSTFLIVSYETLYLTRTRQYSRTVSLGLPPARWRGPNGPSFHLPALAMGHRRGTGGGASLIQPQGVPAGFFPAVIFLLHE